MKMRTREDALGEGKKMTPKEIEEKTEEGEEGIYE